MNQRVVLVPSLIKLAAIGLVSVSVSFLLLVSGGSAAAVSGDIGLPVNCRSGRLHAASLSSPVNCFASGRTGVWGRGCV